MRINRERAARIAGTGPELASLLEACCAQAERLLPVALIRDFPAEEAGLPALFPRCGETVTLAAVTLGEAADRLLMRSGPQRAAVLDVCLNLALMQAFEEAVPGGADFCFPGDGPLPLSYQSALLRLLRANKYAGITCNDCGALRPIKTLTAVGGGGRRGNAEKCGGCGRVGCPYGRTQ